MPPHARTRTQDSLGGVGVVILGGRRGAVCAHWALAKLARHGCSRLGRVQVLLCQACMGDRGNGWLRRALCTPGTHSARLVIAPSRAAVGGLRGAHAPWVTRGAPRGATQRLGPQRCRRAKRLFKPHLVNLCAWCSEVKAPAAAGTCPCERVGGRRRRVVSARQRAHGPPVSHVRGSKLWLTDQYVQLAHPAHTTSSRKAG